MSKLITILAYLYSFWPMPKIRLLTKAPHKFLHSIFLECHLYSVLFKIVASQSGPIAEKGTIPFQELRLIVEDRFSTKVPVIEV